LCEYTHMTLRGYTHLTLTGRTILPHSGRLRKSDGPLVMLTAGRTCPREGTGAEQCIGKPVPVGHARDLVRRVGAGAAGRSDEQGRTEDPGATGTAWVAAGNLDLATLVTGMPDSACAPGAGPAARVQVGIAFGHPQVQFAQAVWDRAQRRKPRRPVPDVVNSLRGWCLCRSGRVRGRS
jgi:hypothetical protein